MLPLLFLLQAGAADANGSCVPFKGGPADGECPGAIISKSGVFELIGLLPATQAGPTIPPPVASALSALLGSQRKGAPIDQQILAPGATGAFCTTISNECSIHTPLKSWPLNQQFVANPPYLLNDGRIRIEWMRDGKLEYLSLIKMDGGKVKDIETEPATMPRINR